MSPRKRAKPNPSTKENNTNLPATLPSQAGGSVASQVSVASGQSMPPIKRNGSDASTSTNPNDIKQVRKSRSWYGSWPRAPKSSASTQVSHQNIMGGTLRSGAAPDFSRFESKKDSVASESDSQSIRALPKISETGVQPKQDDSKSVKLQEANKTDSNDGNARHDGHDALKDQGVPNTTTSDSEIQPSSETMPPPQASSGWFGWLGRSAAPEAAVSKGDNMEVEPPKEPESVEPEVTQLNTQQPSSDLGRAPTEPLSPAKPASSSWFGYWYSSAAIPENSAQVTPEVMSTQQSAPNESPDTVMEDAPPSRLTEASQPSASSTWAFWSRDTGKKDTTKPATTSEPGELAIIGDGSEANPRHSTSPEINGRPASMKEPSIKAPKEAPLRIDSSKRNKRVRPQSMDVDESLPRPGTPQSDISTKTAPAKAATPSSSKSSTQNLLLPSFRNTYRMKDNPSIIRQITQLLLRTQQPPVNHVFLVKEPPKIKKAVAIGIHGLFPASYIRTMIGQPTGTSIRFANHCAEAIRRWAESHGCSDCEIEKIALEGEGKIAERVDNLWKLLLNWIEHIRSADLIVLACHSQGVPVGLMLLEKLIDLGIITRSKIGVCAMAGVSLGPFPDYKSGGMLMGSAAELWQFADPESELSKRYRNALEAVVSYGARIAYIGSIDDQLVPMESSVFSPASHPYIYRAAFIDGRVHAPNFISHLVGFALKLRNLGISDHGLVRELSVSLAGSLYSGEGHSRLYDDEQVYDLAISHTLETTNVTGVPCQIQKPEKLTNPNPYLLPWIMRGLLEEEFVKTELYSETTELLRQFDDWNPSTKALKDVKYRLEAVRSKL